MRRLARHLFTLCAAASLLLCVAVCVLWVRGLFRVDSVGVYDDIGHGVEFRSGTGVAGFIIDADIRPPLYTAWYAKLPVSRSFRPFGGFYFEGSGSFAYVLVPHWLLALTTSVLPALAWRQRRRARRRLVSQSCPRCGYDLRATPDRCPECGTPAR